jgi:hypothetical protein
MTVRKIFAGVMARLLSNYWGRKITKFGQDSAVNPFAEEMAATLNAATVLDGPVVIRNSTDGPGIIIENEGPRNQNSGVSVRNQQGQVTDLGIGLGNMNIIANAVIPLASSEVNPVAAHLFLTKGETPTNSTLRYYGVNVPDSDPSTVNSGQTTGTGAPYIGGVPVGGAIDPTTPTTLPTNPMNPESQGNPYNLHPVIPLTAALLNALSNGALFEAGCGITVTKTNNKYTIEINRSQLTGCGLAADSGTCNIKVDNSALAGDGLGTSGTCALKVNVDDSTIEINSDSLRVKDLGITTGKIAANAVTSAKTTGHTVTISVPTVQSCSGGTLTWTDRTFTFTNGLLTSYT